jgi:ABC-2 type transport system permease protein
MIGDVLTMMWKEHKTMFRNPASRSRLLTLLLTPVMLSTVFPITWGPDWVEDFPPLIIAVIAPAVLVAVMIPDSFAGERERHTLPTLLASRLPDRAILLGKMITPVVVGWGTALLCALLSLVIANVAHGEGRLLLFTPSVALGVISLSFLTATIMAGAGVLTSLRSATRQEATQKLLALIIVPAVVVQVVPLLFRSQLTRWLKEVEVNGAQLLVIIVVVMAVIDVGLFAAAMARFQRSRMILD